MKEIGAGANVEGKPEAELQEGACNCLDCGCTSYKPDY